MARSKVKGTNGKPRKKSTNRDQLKASVHFKLGSHDGDGFEPSMQVKRTNDGDASVYYSGGGTKKTRKAGNKRSANPHPGMPKGYSTQRGMRGVSEYAKTNKKYRKNP